MCIRDRNNDDAMSCMISNRSVHFREANPSKLNNNDVFQLGVYQIVKDASTGILIASDPWGLFAELSLCKKNSLQLPVAEDRASRNFNSQHSMCILSPRASVNNSLPILIEGYSKRHVRSTESINEILYSKFTASEDTMYLKLLNTIIYDGYMTDLLVNVPGQRFCELYAYIDKKDHSITNSFSSQETKRQLTARNGYNLRHSIISTMLGDHFSVSKGSILDLSGTVINQSITCLKTFQTHWAENRLNSSKGTGGDLYEYIDLVLASYVMSIAQLGPESIINQWLQSEGSNLLRFSRDLIVFYN